MRSGRFIYETAAEMPRPPRVRVIPVPMEETVSYRPGAARAPAAILNASMQVEYYDAFLGTEPCLEFGIETSAPVLGRGPSDWVRKTAAECRKALLAGRIPAFIGGEHTLTAGAVHAAMDVHPDLIIVQIDAHADLRDSYRGNPLSHACAMRRCRDEGAEIVSFGVRAYCAEEAEYVKGDRGITAVPVEALSRDGSWKKLLASRLKGRPAYLTVDLDGLDPSVVPAVGTPVPGGLSWREAKSVIDTVFASCRQVAGLDMVELAPGKDDQTSEFAAAQLLYYAISRAAGRR